MSAIVSNIITQTKLIAQTELGASYQELRFVQDVARNHLRGARLSFGVRPLGAIPVSTVTNYYTVDQTFEIILADSIARKDDDSEKEASLGEMYDQADEIFKAMINSKINLAASVLSVSQPTYLEPEIYDDQSMVVLRMQCVVKWRSPT